MNILGDTSAKVKAAASAIADPELPLPDQADYVLWLTGEDASFAGDILAAAAAISRAHLAAVLAAAGGLLNRPTKGAASGATAGASGGRAALGTFEGAAAAAFSNAYARGSLGDTALAFAESLVLVAAPGDRATLVKAYGAAIAKAASTCGPELVAEASASVYCGGTGAQAQAWSEAVAEAVSADRATGCLVLTRAVARARARCAGGAAQAEAQSSVTREVIGECAARSGGAAAAQGVLEACPEMAPSSQLQEKWWQQAAETFTTLDDSESFFGGGVGVAASGLDKRASAAARAGRGSHTQPGGQRFHHSPAPHAPT